jgi:hypothetical protein
MNKKWNDMTTEEKLEVLRHMMNAVRGGIATKAHLLTVNQACADLRSLVSKLEQRLDMLEKTLPFGGTVEASNDTQNVRVASL